MSEPVAEDLFEGLRALSARLAEGDDRGSLPRAIVGEARRGARARAAALYVPDRSDASLVCAATDGGDPTAWPERVPEGAERTLADTYRTGQSLFEPDLARVPIVDHGRCVGVLELRGDGRALPSNIVRAFLETVASLSAPALEAIRRREDQRGVDARQRELLELVAHDLRHPLSVIAMQVGALIGSDGCATARPQLETIARNGARMGRMIEDALDFSQVAAGHIQIDISSEPRDAGEIVREAVARCAEPERVEVSGARGEVGLACDRARLGRVLDHLIGNALKFTPAPGRVAVRIDEEGPELVVTVDDEGIGIPEEELPGIFERPAHRGVRRGKRRGEGVGLGLPICRGLVEAHGGRIWAERKAGRGCRFAFALPRQAR